MGVVDRVSGASSALAVDVVEARLTDAGEAVEVKNLIESAGRSAESKLGIIVVGGGAVSANSLDEVESIETDADVVDQTLIESAGGDHWTRSRSRRLVGKDAEAVEKSVSWDADAGKSGQIVSRVRGTHIAGRSNQEKSLGAGAASILIDLVLSAGGGGDSIGNAVAAFEVISDETDALTEDVVVDLIIGTGDLDGRRTGSWDGVCGRLRSSSHSVGRSVTKRVRALGASSIDVLVGLVLHGIVGAAGDWDALRAEDSDQQG